MLYLTCSYFMCTLKCTIMYVGKKMYIRIYHGNFLNNSGTERYYLPAGAGVVGF